MQLVEKLGRNWRWMIVRGLENTKSRNIWDIYSCDNQTRSCGRRKKYLSIAAPRGVLARPDLLEAPTSHLTAKQRHQSQIFQWFLSNFFNSIKVQNGGALPLYKTQVHAVALPENLHVCNWTDISYIMIFSLHRLCNWTFWIRFPLVTQLLWYLVEGMPLKINSNPHLLPWSFFLICVRTLMYFPHWFIVGGRSRTKECLLPTKVDPSLDQSFPKTKQIFSKG